ncbi:MAG: 6-bladed beta-propeller [Roseivirga sp.]|nr:6-bladed beta-propeller [Roseivirga sp.]
MNIYSFIKRFRVAAVILSLTSLFLILSFDSKGQGLETIVVNPNGAKKVEWSDFARDVKILKLENPDDVIVGRVSKVLFTKDRVLVMNWFAKTIFVFNTDGKYLYSLQAQGKGPGEFERLEDFEVDETTGSVYAFDNLNQKVVAFSLADGKFLKEQRFNFLFATHLTKVGQDWVLFERFNNDGKYQSKIIKADKDFKLKSRELPALKTPLADAYSSNFFYKYKETSRFIFGQNDTVYSASSKGVVPVYHVDFGKYKVDEDYYESTTIYDAMDALKNSNYAAKKANLVETDEWVGFTYVKYNRGVKKKGMWRYALYSKKEKKLSFNLKGLAYNDLDVVIPYPYYGNSNSLVSKLDFYDLFGENEKELNNEGRSGVSEGYGPIESFEEMVRTIRMDDNPYLVFFKPKF